MLVVPSSSQLSIPGGPNAVTTIASLPLIIENLRLNDHWLKLGHMLMTKPITVVRETECTN